MREQEITEVVNLENSTNFYTVLCSNGCLVTCYLPIKRFRCSMAQTLRREVLCPTVGACQYLPVID